jgi:hypothetical protein
LPPPEPLAARELTAAVAVPSPEQLGIRLDEPTAPAVVIPDPVKLGIRLD